MLTPNQDSGSLRTLRLLRILRDIGCRVTQADNLLADEPYAQALRDVGIGAPPHVHSLKSFDSARRRVRCCDIVSALHRYTVRRAHQSHASVNRSVVRYD